MEIEPITLEEAKANLRVIGEDEDDDIEAMISAARVFAEGQTGLVLTARLITETFDDFGRFGTDLTSWPVRAITGITYVDPAGEEQALDLALCRYTMKRRPVRIVPAVGTPFPLLSGQPGGLAITVDAGFATPDDVPWDIRRALLMLISHFYENRNPVAADRAAVATMPLGVELILGRHRQELI